MGLFKAIGWKALSSLRFQTACIQNCFYVILVTQAVSPQLAAASCRLYIKSALAGAAKAAFAAFALAKFFDQIKADLQDRDDD